MSAGGRHAFRNKFLSLVSHLSPHSRRQYNIVPGRKHRHCKLMGQSSRGFAVVDGVQEPELAGCDGLYKLPRPVSMVESRMRYDMNLEMALLVSSVLLLPLMSSVKRRVRQGAHGGVFVEIDGAP